MTRIGYEQGREILESHWTEDMDQHVAVNLEVRRAGTEVVVRSSGLQEPDALGSAPRGFLNGSSERLWVVDQQVLFDGSWDRFFNELKSFDASLLATTVRTYSEDPKWVWWASLKAGNEALAAEVGVAALLPLLRIDRLAADQVLKGLDSDWSGHPGALVPTLVNRAGLRTEYLGGGGRFTPAGRAGRWYDDRTWHWRGPVQTVPGELHFPTTLARRPLAAARLAESSPSRSDARPTMLYASPVGGSSADLLEGVLNRCMSAGANCLLLEYDETPLEVPEQVKVVRDTGYKFQLASRHLRPDFMEAYDYVFFWDDDLEVEDFNPLRFVRIMEASRLSMALPAIQSQHGLSHSITRQRPVPPPRMDAKGGSRILVVGRLTNFVEVMAPVFTREAWSDFYGYLDLDNRSGWGYHYIPLGRKGVVDALPVVHTRAVQSMTAASETEIGAFLEGQGLFRHGHVDQGWLFEPQSQEGDSEA